MVWVLICFPLAMAAIALAMPQERWRPWLLPAAGVLHLVLCASVSGSAAPGAWLGLDALGRVVLLLVSVLFTASSFYAVGYLREEPGLNNRIFCTCMLAFLGTMTLLTCAHHYGLMWVAMEATTLASAPLIYFHRTALSLEATWKYLLICSVGIAVALLGSFFLAYASLHQGLHTSLQIDDMLRSAPSLSAPWLKAAFVLLLVGYGTKMGLAPMHTWLPDAHGEAPAPVSAMLSGALLPCAFLPILRAYGVCAAAGQGAFARGMLLGLGLLSIGLTAGFVIRQRDLKRMLAYSSVENMGILALGVGIGGLGLFGALLHMINNGLTKSMLFFSAGNILRAYGSKSTQDVSGVLRRMPLTGVLFLAGFLAITGSPPFGPFLSEFTILRAAVEEHRFVTAGAFLLLLFVVFLGMGATVLRAVHGRAASDASGETYRERWLTSLPGVALLATVVILGVWVPGWLQELLHAAARSLELRP